MIIERKVHVVDDDISVLRTLARLLRSAGFRAIPYATSLTILEAASELSGCVLLDVRMPGMDGLALQQSIGSLRPNLPIIMMTGHGDVQTAVRAMKQGAVDFIEKPFTEERLIGAIEGAFNVSRALSDLDREAVDATLRLTALTRREREVLDGLVAGHPNKIIAVDLGISARTVEVHRARMLDRLRVRSVAEAIRLRVMARMEVAPSHG